MSLMDKHQVVGRAPRYHFRETVTDTTSEALLIPSESRGVVVGVSPGTSARVEVTISTLAAIEADTALWFAWASGDVGAATIDFVDFNVTALRLVSSGEGTWEVSA